MLSFVASSQTKGKDELLTNPFTQRYISETVSSEGWRWGRAGVSAEWIQRQLPPLLPSEKRDLTLLRHQRRQQKRFAKDAARWHHVKSITDKVDYYQLFKQWTPHPINWCKLRRMNICVKHAKRQQHNEAEGTTRWFNSNSTCAQLKVCQDYLWPE